MAEIEIRPQPGPQTVFLASRADIAVYGGAAGGGKTWALLAEPIRHIHNPAFGCVIFRRTCPQIVNEGALWDESTKLYPLAGATGLVGSMDWRFPSGANVGMRHIHREATKYDWQGAQICLVEFDELTHFTEGQFFYMFSRNRSTSGIRPYIRASTNPDAGSWVKTFLAPWVDESFKGERAASGELRWMIRDAGRIEWVPEGTADARSVTFVRASVFDNKILLASNPEYVSNLRALPPVEQARLLDGDWTMRREGLVYPGLFAPGVIVEPSECPDAKPDLGGIDYGFSNPFCALQGLLDRDDVLWVTAERYQAGETVSVHALHLPRYVRWWSDPAGADQTAELRRAGHEVTPCVHIGRKPLLTGIDQVTTRIRSGRLKVSRACEQLIRECGLYMYDPEKQIEEPLDANNHCLPAGTIIETADGPRPIEQVEAGCFVRTREGFNPVVASGLTSAASPLWTLECSDGKRLEGTASHRVWTENRGWIRLNALRYRDILSTVSRHGLPQGDTQCLASRAATFIPRLNASSSAGFLSEGIPNPIGWSCGDTSHLSMATGFIKPSGSTITARSRQGTTSTIATRTRSITRSRTSSACPAPTISLRTGPRSGENRLDSRSNEPAKRQMPGTALRQGLPGTASLESDPGSGANRSRRLASNAGPNSRASRSEKTTATARTTASPHGGERPASMTLNERARSAERSSPSIATARRRPAPVFVLDVSPSGRSAPVYDLTVAGLPEFFANGILVHNSADALRYLVVGLDRGRVVTPMGADPTVAAAQIVAEQAQAERVQDEHRSIENPMWWGGSDDG